MAECYEEARLTSDRAPALEREIALERVGGDVDLLREIAQLYLDECPILISEIRRATAEGNAARLERSAHTLKGASANFGASEVVVTALAVERSARSGQANCPLLISDLLKAVEGLHQDLECFLATGR